MWNYWALICYFKTIHLSPSPSSVQRDFIRSQSYLSNMPYSFMMPSTLQPVWGFYFQSLSWLQVEPQYTCSKKEPNMKELKSNVWIRVKQKKIQKFPLIYPLKGTAGQTHCKLLAFQIGCLVFVCAHFYRFSWTPWRINMLYRVSWYAHWKEYKDWEFYLKIHICPLNKEEDG